jgi:hypothetical protein
MAIEYRIHHDQRIVVAEGVGALTDDDFFRYQRDVWGRAEVAGFDELVDMRRVEHVPFPTAERMRMLASLSAEMDPPACASKLAIVAPSDVMFGLGRMYETYRGMNGRSTKRVAVFRCIGDACEWLAIADRGTILSGSAAHTP